MSFSHVVRMGAALAITGAAFLHLDAAGDHTDHPHIAGFFVAAAVAQLMVAAAISQRVPPRRAMWWAVIVNGGLLVTWIVSRTTGLPFVPSAEEVEPLGWKDVAASGLELATLATLGLAAAMPAAAAAVAVGPAFARRVLTGVAAGTLALAVPGVLTSHDHDHTGSAAHDHGDAELAADTVHVHDATHDGGAAHTEDQAAADAAAGHVHGEVTDAAGAAGATDGTGGHNADHDHASAGAAPAAGSDPSTHDHAAAPAGVAHDPEHNHSAGPDPTFAGPPAPDPLAGPGTVSTVRFGPLPLLPQVAGVSLPHLTPALPGASPGRLNLLPLVGIPSPCNNCYVLGVKPDLVYADGSPANLDTGPMLHHVVISDPSQADPVCGRDTLIGQALGRRVFASGNERTGAALPDGFGVPITSPTFNGALELMNASDQLRLVFVQLTIRWVPTSTAGIRPVMPVWLDIDSCGDSEVDLPAGVTDTTWDWTSNLTGRIVTAGGHVHDGGTWIGLTNTTTGEHVCNSLAGYGTNPRYMGAIESMTVCSSDRLATVRAGDVLRLNAHYNAAAPVKAAMGIMMIFVYETDDLAGGNPSPYPAETPPDGAPLDDHQHVH